MSPPIKNPSIKKRWLSILKLCLFLFFLLPSISSSVNLSQFSPYIEKFTMGSIDWDKGLIYGVGRAYYDGSSSSKHIALGVAQVLASGNIVKLAAGLRLDDKKILQDLGKEKVTISTKAFIRDAEVSKVLKKEKGRQFYEVTRVAHLKGIEGVTAKILSATSKNPVDWIPPPINTTQKTLDNNEPWLVLDARNLPLTRKAQPALFPKVFSEKGEEIYSVRLVGKNELLQRGMASYVVSGNLKAELEPIESILDRVSEMLATREAFAAENRKRSKRQRFVIVDVKNTTGLQKTNLVISATDANGLKNENVASKILQNCRVIVVMSSPIGGIEGAIFKIITTWS